MRCFDYFTGQDESGRLSVFLFLVERRRECILLRPFINDTEFDIQSCFTVAVWHLRDTTTSPTTGTNERLWVFPLSLFIFVSPIAQTWMRRELYEKAHQYHVPDVPRLYDHCPMTSFRRHDYPPLFRAERKFFLSHQFRFINERFAWS